MSSRAAYTHQAGIALIQRSEAAKRLGDDFVGAKHILLGLLNIQGASAPDILLELGCDISKLKVALENVADERQPGKHPDRVYQTRDADAALAQAIEEATEFKSAKVGTEHILLGALKRRRAGTLKWVKSDAAKLMEGQFGVTYAGVKRHILERSVSAA